MSGAANAPGEARRRQWAAGCSTMETPAQDERFDDAIPRVARLMGRHPESSRRRLTANRRRLSPSRRPLRARAGLAGPPQFQASELPRRKTSRASPRAGITWGCRPSLALRKETGRPERRRRRRNHRSPILGEQTVHVRLTGTSALTHQIFSNCRSDTSWRIRRNAVWKIWSRRRVDRAAIRPVCPGTPVQPLLPAIPR